MNNRFSVTLSYYGILYFLPNLAGQRHLNFFYGALIELLSYIMSYFIFSGFGRRLPMATLQYCNGALILFMAILSALPAGSYSQCKFNSIQFNSIHIPKYYHLV